MDEVLGELGKLILSQPEDVWLTIHHKVGDDDPWVKPVSGVNVPVALRKITGTHARMQFLNWGRHQGSNAYRDVRNVIVLGWWRKPPENYEAAYMAASGLPLEVVDSEVLSKMRISGHMEDLLQAIGRSNIRERDAEGDINVYLVANMEDGLLAAINETFPGCTIEAWKTVDRPLTKQQQRVAEFLTMIFAQGVTQIEKIVVRQHLGISTPAGLNQVIRDERMVRWLADNAIIVTSRRLVKLAADTMPSTNAA